MCSPKDNTSSFQLGVYFIILIILETVIVSINIECSGNYKCMFIFVVIFFL